MFTPTEHPAAPIAIRIAQHQLMEVQGQKAAADLIIEEQNQALAEAHAALLIAWAHLHETTPFSVIKVIAGALDRIERGRK